MEGSEQIDVYHKTKYELPVIIFLRKKQKNLLLISETRIRYWYLT